MTREDDGPSTVEFVVDAQPDSADEDLAPPPSRPVNPRWTLAGGAAVLVAAALIARAVSHNNEPGAPSPVASASSVPAAIASPGTGGLVAPESNRPFPDPGPHRFPDSICLPPASCTTASTLPGAARAALFAVFPTAVVTRTTTVLSTRADKMAPDVVVRSIRAAAGSTSITIGIRMARGSDTRSTAEHRGPHTSETTVREIELGYLVTVTVDRPGSPVKGATVDGLAGDPGLIVP